MKTAISLLLFFTLLSSAARAETLSLSDCLALAAKGNPALKVAAFEERTARETQAVARSGFLPRVDLQAGYTAQLEPQSIRFATGSVTTQDSRFPFFNLAITQTLYDFGRTEARVQRAELTTEALSQSYVGQEKETFLQVVQAYYAVLEGMKLEATAAEEIVQRQEHLRVAQNLYEQGVVTRNDLLQAEVRLADSRQRHLDAANRVENAWLRLNFLTGQPPRFRADLQDAPDPALAIPESVSAEEAFAARPELAALRKSLEVNRAEVKEARSMFLPEIFARLGVDYVENSRVQEQAIYHATVGLRVNLFEGFATTARERQAVQNRSRTEERLRLEQERIALELQIARNDLRVAAERIRTIEQSIRQGEENVRINRDRYSEQVGTATEVLDAQTLLTQVKNEYHRAQYARNVARARILHALGKL